ncbi:MAG: hypothetical protein ACRDF4_02535, partial [Rhabdochlamydiaceae bacterium]
QTLTGQNTNNIYWNAQTAPTSSGRTYDYGTVGQDLDPANGSLSLWQWANPNYVFGPSQTSIPQTGSYDGGGPSFCSTYSQGQERHSVYMMIVNSATNRVYTMSGAELLEQSNAGVTSTTFVVYVNPATAGGAGPSTQSCPVVSNPRDTPYLRWFIRSPPTTEGISGNFAVIGTVGAQLNVATNTHAIQLFQFIDRTYETGYMPPAMCPTCVVPNLGSSSTTLSSSTTTVTSTTSDGHSSMGTIVLNISPLTGYLGKYRNTQITTVLDQNGRPLAGVSITLYENAGKAAGYAHGITNSQGQFVHVDRYPGPGTYTEWAEATLNGQVMDSAKVIVVVP